MTQVDTATPAGASGSILSGLNPRQQEAVTQGDGPVLVFAGAGSGKTRVLTHRIAYMIQVLSRPPWSIMAVTFTNKAAGEMRERILELTGPEGESVAIGTFHSICSRILRRERRERSETDFTIYDGDDQRRLMKQALTAAGIAEDHLAPAAALAMISRLKNELIAPESFEPKDYGEGLVAQTYPLYQELLRRNNAYDFDDLLMETVKLFRSQPEILERYRRRYRHILVDEYQDTNHAQYALISLLASEHRNLFVVGDADQAIYGWRGADIRNILDFERHFPDARSIILDQNYRSTQNVLDAAHGVIVVNENRPKKKLWTERERGPLIRAFEAANEVEEARFVAREIGRLVRRGKAEASSCAVMYRTNLQSRVLEEALIREGIQHKLVGSIRFYERREIKDVLAYLRVAANPADGLSLARVVNVPPRKIGATTLAALNRWSQERGLSLWDAVLRVQEVEGVRNPARGQLQKVAVMLEGIQRFARERNVVETLDHILEVTGYGDWLRKEPDSQERLENVQELCSVATVFAGLPPLESLEALLERTALIGDADEIDEAQGSVTLMTMHLAKGLEFDVVFLAGMEEDLFPHFRSQDSPERMEEERRLCYVGITRARRLLYLTYAVKRTLMGWTHRNAPSRFLLNISEDLFGPGSSLPRLAANRSDSHENVPDQWGFAGESGCVSITEQSFTQGDRVYHKHFGLGTILSSTLAGGDEEVEVEFTAQGKPVTKRLSVLLSGIEPA